ncbi:hypothetical protein E2C01_089294 [Portunus trituberculatus]|uniref:Uncharacterized protein n=1 Tax=Portunus trituberculatus TaxID=210409 RepID=A0A5B7J8F2_PORTR|nr:hypothetical protein [Portunus trituberculatus]
MLCHPPTTLLSTPRSPVQPSASPSCFNIQLQLLLFRSVSTSSHSPTCHSPYSTRPFFQSLRFTPFLSLLVPVFKKNPRTVS